MGKAPSHAHECAGYPLVCGGGAGGGAPARSWPCRRAIARRRMPGRLVVLRLATDARHPCSRQSAEGQGCWHRHDVIVTQTVVVVALVVVVGVVEVVEVVVVVLVLLLLAQR